MIDTAAWFVLMYLKAIESGPGMFGGWVLAVVIWYHVLTSAEPRQ